MQAALDAAATRAAAVVGTDGPARLRERAAILGIGPQGRQSAGGTCRLVQAADGWFALNLARADDRDALEAWACRPIPAPIWDGIEAVAAGWTADAAVERAQLLGIPAARALAPAAARVALAAPPDPDRRAVARGDGPVLDLSALWAGPLCARLLGDALGRPVVKVESVTRPDGARAGHPEFWRRLNAGKDEVVVDFSRPEGRGALAEWVAGASVVVTSARPRAWAGLGLDPTAVVARGTTWVSITGYGVRGPRANWVAFGDDAAVAGGLSIAVGGDGAPAFVGDAVADPLAGLTAAARVVDRLAQGEARFVDVSLARVVNEALSAP